MYSLDTTRPFYQVLRTYLHVFPDCCSLSFLYIWCCVRFFLLLCVVSKLVLLEAEISSKDKYNHPEMQPDKHSRRKDDSEDTDKWPADNRDGDDRKTLSRYEHGKSRSSKEQRFDDDKYKEKYKDDYGRDKRQQDDKFLDERVIRGHESVRADYKSAKDGHRSSESHYRKETVHDGDHYEDYSNRSKERGKKRPHEENDDQYESKPLSTRDQRVNLEKSSGSGRLDSLIERARPDRSSSPSKIHSRSSPSPSSYHDKDQSR